MLALRASLNGHNFSSVVPITLILQLSERLGRDHVMQETHRA